MTGARSIIEYIPTYSYFNHYDDLTGTILDFGSNSGNLLRSSRGKIDPAQYTGVDVIAAALEAGKAEFPGAAWVLSNRFHPCYNPTGELSSPKLPRTDKVFSYSVFSHFPLSEILYTLDQLRSAGRLFFSYCNVQRPECVEWFRNRRVDCDQVDSTVDFAYLTDSQLTFVSPRHCEKFVSFFSPAFLIEQLRQAGFHAVSHAPPPGWRQDCLEVVSS